MTDTNVPKTQRFDAFFKEIFKQSIDPFLDILNIVTEYDIGNVVVSELPEEVSKGILRADFIIKTNRGYTLIFEFKDEIGIDAYSALSAYTATHSHTTKAYISMLSKNKNRLPYVPVIIGFSIQKKYKEHLMRLGLISKIPLVGVYIIAMSPYYEAFVFVLNDMDIAKVIVDIAINHPKLKNYSDVLSQLNTIEFWTRAMHDNYYREVATMILQYFKELLLLVKHDTTYFRNIYEFANLYTPEYAKDILNLMVIIFLKKKVDGIMSLSKVLTLEEKKKIIEAFGIEAAIEAFGIEKVIESVGIEKVIEAIGIEKVIEAIGIEKVVNAVGVEKIIDIIKKLVDEGKIDKKYLKKLLE